MNYKIFNRRYTGSKYKLLPWIKETLKKECVGKTFLDIFAGTGVVSAYLKDDFEKIVLNDFLYSNYIIYKAFFEKTKFNKKFIEQKLFEYNALTPSNLNPNYFSENYGNKYFDYNTSKKIGFIRNDIENLKERISEKEFSILLTSLLYSIDKIANTCGHYDSYRRTKPEKKEIILKPIEQINVNCQIYSKDSNKLAKEIHSDIVYIDPPYNSRQYERFYHVLENTAKWNKPKLHGIAMKPNPDKISSYCKTEAPLVFDDLIQNLSCNYIIVSYNNTFKSKSKSSKNKIKFHQIMNSLKRKGETKFFEKKHKFFNAGNTDFNDHKEFLFLTKVNN